MKQAAQRHLVLEVKLEGGRFHGEPEWPPAPARVFQALVAASARRDDLEQRDVEALEWLESLPPPLMAAPPAVRGRAVKFWVPNNDLDARGGIPEQVQSIRTGKWVHPRIFDADVPLLYLWPVGDAKDELLAARVCEIALGLYQLGRGIDMAWAKARFVGEEVLAAALDAHHYKVHRPTKGAVGEGVIYKCPQPGTLSSLRARHAASLARFDPDSGALVFSQPPKARFNGVAYDAAPPRALFELRPEGEIGAFSSTRLAAAVRLTEIVRDAAVARLQEALGNRAVRYTRVILGRADGQANPVPSHERVRLVPIPSVGHEHVDRFIRRFLVEVPHQLASKAEDIFWAFSGLEVETPAGASAVLVRADDTSMLRYFGVGDSSLSYRHFRTVTPAALPAMRRRIAPEKISEEAKPAPERAREEDRARVAVIQALRHAEVASKAAFVHVQREPFHAKEARAEAFAAGTRFPKERLWHVEVRFRQPVPGPLVIGDGRFLGLGLMASVDDAPPVLAYDIIEGATADAVGATVAVALRRAVMARYQEFVGYKRRLPALITGHDAAGPPSKVPVRLAYLHDAERQRLLVVPTYAGGAYVSAEARKTISTLARAMEGFRELRAGAAGLLRVRPTDVDMEADALFAAARCWRSVTPYTVNRHAKAADAEVALVRDVEESLHKAHLPRAGVEVERVWAEPGVGIKGRVVLAFGKAVTGPLLLGRDRYKGGGLFEGF